MFCIATQRRYETGYSFVQSLINEVRERFNMPITSVQAFYSDGLWIFPDEILHQRMHPFNEGYGMLSHSAFHILDAVWSLYADGCSPIKQATMMETVAGATYPDGFIHNFSPTDYHRVFGWPVTRHDNSHYPTSMQGFGEMDVTANHILKRNGTPIATFSINLLHNSFSRRSWVTAAQDLYKGNGRVKHQSYIIQQGPFQSIQIHNYQAVADHDTGDKNTQQLGGKNHFDIHVFRNAELFPPGEKPVSTYSSSEIDEVYKNNSSKLSNEIAKSIMIDEFIDNCHQIRSGKRSRNSIDARNTLHTYGVPTKMMSDLYLSLARRNGGRNPLVESAI